MDSFHIPSFLIGFAAGAILCGLFLVLSGRIKSLAVGSIKIEGHEREPLAPSTTEETTELDVPVSGRWHAKPNSPDAKFNRFGDGVTTTPTTLTIKPGEVYQFSADFGFSDADMRKLVKLADQPQLRYLVLYRCQHLSSEALELLGRMIHLWDLDIKETNVSDSVLLSLQSLKSLRSLQISARRVSGSARDRFQQAVPNCKVREV
jgi:hypothetical protein